MPKAISAALLALGLALLLAAPGFAEDNRPGVPGSDERNDYCDLEYIKCDQACEEEWGHLPGIFWPTCREGCDYEWGYCKAAPRTGRLANNILDILQSPGVLDQAGDPNANTVPVGSLGAAELERACTSVRGVFGKSTDGFGRMNPRCAETGVCVVICFRGRCVAMTPARLPDGVTLIGILQNGNNVVRGGGEDSGGSLSEGGEGVPDLG